MYLIQVFNGRDKVYEVVTNSMNELLQQVQDALHDGFCVYVEKGEENENR